MYKSCIYIYQDRSAVRFEKKGSEWAKVNLLRSRNGYPTSQICSCQWIAVSGASVDRLHLYILKFETCHHLILLVSTEKNASVCEILKDNSHRSLSTQHSLSLTKTYISIVIINCQLKTLSAEQMSFCLSLISALLNGMVYKVQWIV